MSESARDVLAKHAADRADRMQGIPDHVRADAILAALAAAGYKILSREPTEVMVKSDDENTFTPLWSFDAGDNTRAAIWRAMFDAAAPHPPQEKQT